MFRGVKSRYLVITLKAVVGVLVWIAVAALGFWLFSGSLFEIKTISCQKENFDCPVTIMASFEEARGQNIFLYKTKTLTRNVEKRNPELKQVLIKKQLPNALRVTLVSRQPFAILEMTSGQAVVADEEGFVLGMFQPDRPLPHLKVVSLPVIGEMISDPILVKELNLAKLLQVSYLNFEYISYSDETSFNVLFLDNVVATVSAQKDLVPQVDSLQYILSHSRMKDKALKTVDLRFQKPIVTFTP